MDYLRDHYKEVFATCSVILSGTNLILYFRQMLCGKVKPHAFSWLIWFFVMVVVFAAQTLSGGGAGAWQLLSGGILCGIIGAVALRKGEQKIVRSDWFALVGAGLALPVWFLTKNPLHAVIILTLTDGIGFYPTFRKSWLEPWQESTQWLLCATVVFSLNSFALTHYNPTTLIYPITMIILHSGLMFILLARRCIIPKFTAT